ncbi:MAG: sporulation protein, partial [Candidatus Competibacter sp.]
MTVDNRLAQRLVGVAVVAALAVVFVPEMLEKPHKPAAVAPTNTSPPPPQPRPSPVPTLTFSQPQPAPPSAE